jgi:tetratricopeptide (TPR) repeat protein
MKTRKWLRIMLLAGAVLSPAICSAYNFSPTAAEFAAWPSYCKARYGHTSIGSRSQYANSVNQAGRDVARATLGDATYDNVHHFCAAMSYLSRAKVARTPAERKLDLRNAHNNMMYSWNRITPDMPLYAPMVITMAQIENAQGNSEEAIEYLTAAIEARPSDAQFYAALAITYRDQKQLKQARETLERGVAASEGSVELHYNLGLICLELRDVECAVQHAQVAYEGGHPFPGLKNKLTSIGRWPQ